MTEPGRLFQFDQPVERAQVDAKLIRDLFTALALNNYTTDAAYPASPREGMLRCNAVDPLNIKLEFWHGSPGAWRTVLQNIQGGLPAPVKRVVQVTTAASTWTIDHNLGGYVIALVFDAAFRQLRVAHTYDRVALPLGRIDLSLLLVPGPIRLGIPTPFDGLIRRSWAFAGQTGVLGVPGGVLALDIGGTPLVGGQINIMGPLLPGTRISGAVITASNAFLKGADNINLTVFPVAPGAPGDLLDVWIELERTLQADEYLLEQPTENRIIVTHQAPTVGWVVLLG